MFKDAKTLKTFLIILVIFLITVFIFFNSRELLLGIKIRHVNIKDGMTVSENYLEITGVAKNAVKLTLNGREIPINQKGNFRETILLFSGYNVIEIKAQDKFGSEDEKNYKIMFKPEAQELQ